MKSILSTCTLFLVLAWTLIGETTLEPSTIKQEDHTSDYFRKTLRSNTTILALPTTEIQLKTSSTKQHEYTLKDNETTMQGDESTTAAPKSIEHLVKSNTTKQHEDTHEDYKSTLMSKETTMLALRSTEHPMESSTTTQHEDTSKYHETSIKSDEPTSFTPKNIGPSLKPSSTKQQEFTSKDQEKENVSSSKLPPQTFEHQHVTSMTHGNAKTISTGESTSHLALLTEYKTQKTTDQIAITPLIQSISKGLTVTRDDQTVNLFKSTNKGLDIHTKGKKTTRSAEKESFKTLIVDGSTPFQKTPGVITNQTQEEVQTAVTMSTKWSSLPQEKESTHPPKFNVTDSNGTLDISTKMIQPERNDSATYPLGTSTTTSFSTSLNPFDNPENGTTYTADTTETNATYKTTTIDMKERQNLPPLITTLSTMQTKTTDFITSKAPIKDKNKVNPGKIVASLIGCILLLMFLAFVMIFVKNRQSKKKLMENTDWAGPSPFIEGDINPNTPTIIEDGSFHRRESKRISLHSFLPQRLSKRLSFLSPTDEEIPLEGTQASSTFGQHHLQPLNGQATPPNVIQTYEANSPPAEVSSNSNVPETVSISPPSENNEDIETTPKLDEKTIQAPPAETNGVDPTAFEDVDLNVSPAKDAESSPPTDATHIPTPPPLAPS
ncbi:protein EVI2B isoform X1 [Silurus meridionalis]|uniref:protein EVI2B isoform X1 n=1 Tax=Silurus meridionalis TaxID=175797 RepID=UPI001EEC228C|nr:protein EVI2B isoform X1 [Silurus meridionalis]